MTFLRHRLPVVRHIQALLMSGLLSAAALHPAAAAPRCTQPLRAVFVDIDLGPYLPGQGDAFAKEPGLFVSWIEREAARLGCKLTLTRLPPARLLTALAEGEADIGVGLAPTTVREKVWVFPRDAEQRINPKLALFESEIGLYVQRSQRAALGWDGQRFAKPVTIAGAKESAPLLLAQQRGWATLAVQNTPQGVRMLRANRFEVLVAPDVLMPASTLKLDPEVVALSPPLAIKAYYAPVSPALWKRNPELVRSLWLGLCRSGRTAAAQTKQLAGCELP